MTDWIKCDGVRIKNGKLYLKNPSLLDKLKFGFGGIKKLAKTKGKKGSVYKPSGQKFGGSKYQGAPKTVKAAPISLTQDMKDAVEALVGQGAKKQQAALAVKAARARGAQGFEGLFRGALKEL